MYLYVKAILLGVLALLFVGNLSAEAEKLDKENCTWNDIPLHGKVEIKASGGDIKIQVKTNFPDLKVDVVSIWPDKCGEWQFVENWGDFSITFVDHWPDITIKFVENFPGIK